MVQRGWQAVLLCIGGLLLVPVAAADTRYDELSVGVSELVGSGQYAEALPLARQLAAEHPEDYFSQLELYRSAAAMKAWPEALASADKLIRLAPRTFEPYYFRASALQGVGQYAEAARTLEAKQWKSRMDAGQRRDYTRLVDKTEAAAHPDALALYQSVTKEMSVPERRKALLSTMDKAIELSPNYYLYYAARGYLHYYLDSSRQALRDFKRATELNPWYDDSYFWLACQHFDNRDYEDALQAIVWAQILDSKDERYGKLSYSIKIKYAFGAEFGELETKFAREWSNRFPYVSDAAFVAQSDDGEKKLKAGDTQGAFAAFGRALAIASAAPAALQPHYSAALTLKKYSAALGDAMALIALQPDKIGNYLKKAQAEILLQDYAAARATLRADKWDDYDTRLADILEKDRLLDEIEQAEHPAAFALLKRADGLSDNSDFVGAEKLLDEAIRINPDFYRYWMRRGGMRLTRSFPDALSDLHAAQGLNKQNVLTRALIGYVYKQLGNTEAAWDYLAPVVKLTDQFAFAKEIYNEISAAKGREFALELQRKEAEAQREAAARRQVEAENARLQAEIERRQAAADECGWACMNARASKEALQRMQSADSARRNSDAKRNANCIAGDGRSVCR